MSGGSYNYLCYKMEEGDGLTEFFEYRHQVIDDLKELLAAVEARQDVNNRPIERWDRATEKWVAMTDDERSRFLVAIGAALACVESMAKRVEAVQADMRGLAAVMHALEWKRSGDWGVDNAAAACLSWMMKKLGVEEKP